MYKALVFDFDDTIVDSNKIKKKVFIEILGEMGFGEDKVLAVVRDENKSRFEVFHHFLYNHSEKEINMKIETFSKKVFEEICKLKPAQDFYSIVSLAKENNVFLFLSSNTPEEQLLRIINKIGISHIFNQVHGYPKDKKQTLKKIIDEFHLLSDKVLVIGDGQSDRLSAEKNDVDFFQVKNLSLPNLKFLLNGG